MPAPRNEEKILGKHPTQKPIALIERCLLASTNPGDLILDPFLGSGTTAIAALRLSRHFIGIELDLSHAQLARSRTDRQIIGIWLKHFQVRINISVSGGARLRRALISPKLSIKNTQLHFPLDLYAESINGSSEMSDQSEIQTERIFHETKFVFLACGADSSRRSLGEDGSVVHTTLDVSLQEAWAKTPTGKKRETTHIVRCETEIFRVKSS